MKTQDGEGEIVGLETLKERVKVKLKDGEEAFFKRYDAKDVKVIRDVQRKYDEEQDLNAEDLAELEALEKLEQTDVKNEDDM